MHLAAHPAPDGRGLIAGRLDTRLKVLGGGLIAAVLLIGLMIVTAKPDPQTVTENLLTGLAARQADAGQLLAAESDLGPIAEYLGFAILPESVTVTLSDLTLRELDRSTDDETTVIAEWTAHATGADGELSRAQQTATVYLGKGADGEWRVLGIDAPVALPFNLETYFGGGSTAADRDEAMSDLTAGTAWLTAVFIEPISSVETVAADPIYTDDPDRFDWDQQVTSEGRHGEITHWGIAISGLRSQSFDLASAETSAAEPEQLSRGTLTEEGVIADALDAAQSWVADLDAGVGRDALDDPSAISDSALARMAIDAPAMEEGNAFVVETDPTIQVSTGDLLLERQPGGTWKIDTGGSVLITGWLPGSGADLTVTQRKALVDFSDCADEAKEAQVTFHFEGIEFRSGPEPHAAAIFTATATGDVECAAGITFDDVTVSWRGGSERVVATGESDATPQTIYVELPAEVRPDDVPITLTVEIEAIDSFDWERRTGARGEFVAGQ